MYMHANEFAAKTKLPLSFVKRACREGKIPHLSCGNAYLLNEETALKAIQELEKESCTKREPLRLSNTGSFSEELKLLRKEV